MAPVPADIEIRDLGVDDVPALIECIRRCYGESYTEHELYDPQFLGDALAAGRLLSVGALAGGRVVGHIGARVPRDDLVAETIGGVVDPEHRGVGLTRRIGARLAERYRRAGIAAVIHHATGAHDRTQRLIVASGGVPTGVLLAHLPAGTDYRGIDHRFAGARIGVVVYVQTHGGLDALDVHVAPRYADRVRDLYRQLSLERRVVTDAAVHPSADDMVAAVRHDDRRRISWLRFGALAHGGTRRATDVLAEALPRSEEVVYADVPIGDPRAPDLTEVLVGHGFVFGALVPGDAGSETIRLQRLADAPVAPEAVLTASDGGAELLAWIVGQYEAATPAAPGQPLD